MRKLTKSFCAVLLCLALLALIPLQAFAAGPIAVDAEGTITLHYVDGETPIVNAQFDLFRVADVDPYADITVTEDFKDYPIDLSEMDQDAWMALASTLKPYVLHDGLTPADTGFTDETGTVSFPSEGVTLNPGLYLVIGYRATTDDFNTYWAVPFMLFIPCENMEENIWEYDITGDMIANVKFDKEINPPDEEPDRVLTRKVMKLWDDKGYETARPAEITVNLLCDGEIYDTQKLSDANNWRYAWDNLEADHDWDLYEEPVEGYAVTKQLNNLIFTVTNKFIAPIVPGCLTVSKKVDGDKPEAASNFEFVMKPADPANPMPEGSENGIYTFNIEGAGSKVLPPIRFEKAGTYAYTISENKIDAQYYTFDVTVYEVVYTVTETNGELSSAVTITNTLTKEASALVFTNVYKEPEPILPQTGLLWWPVPVLLALGLVLLIAGIGRRKVNN